MNLKRWIALWGMILTAGSLTYARKTLPTGTIRSPIQQSDRVQQVAYPVRLGTERTTVTDSVTKLTKTYLTSGRYIDYIFYMHAGVWDATDRYVMAESDRPRPDGMAMPGEHQLLKIDTETGDIYWLATVPVAGTRPVANRYFHACYTEAGYIVYMDMSATRLMVLRLSDGKQAEIATIKGGTLIDPPQVSADGKDILYMASLNGPAPDEKHNGKTYALFHIGFRLADMTVTAHPRQLYAAPGLRGINKHGEPYTLMPIGHAQFRPHAPGDILYVHELNGHTDGSPELTYLWQMKQGGAVTTPLTVMPDHSYDTHAIFGLSGKYVYFVRSGQLYRINFDTGLLERLSDEKRALANHLTISDDEKIIAYDLPFNGKFDHYDNRVGRIGLFYLSYQKSVTLSGVTWGKDHPRHPHPVISHNGQKVVWNEAIKSKCRIVYMDSLLSGIK